jgi:hypothetical protein
VLINDVPVDVEVPDDACAVKDLRGFAINPGRVLLAPSLNAVITKENLQMGGLKWCNMLWTVEDHLNGEKHPREPEAVVDL